MNQQLLAADSALASFDQDDVAALRDSIGSVLDCECDSLALHRYIDNRDDLAARIWAQAGEMGWMALGLPEAYGGLGMAARGLSALYVELGARLVPGPFIATLCAAQAILGTADAAVKKTWLPRLAAGEISAAVPVAIDLQFGRPPVVRADGKITLLGNIDAGLALVPWAGAWALVDLHSVEMSDVSMWDPTRSVVSVEISALEPAATLPQTTGMVLAQAMATAVAADSLGGAQAISRKTIDYMKSRVQFGRAIASFQALKHRIADIVAAIATHEQLLAQCIDMDGHVDAGLWSALAKAEISDAYVHIAADCIQLHGGVGFTWDFDPHLFLKRARLNEMLINTNPAMRDHAAGLLAVATRAGRTTVEL